jgi:hypothetical protein
LNKIRKKSFIPSGDILNPKRNDIQTIPDSNKKFGLIFFLRSVYLWISNFIGLDHYKHRLIISDEFRRWIKEFKPDFIYCQLSSLETIKFVTDLNSQLMIPVVIHFMDDWPITITNRQKWVFKKFWQKKIDKDLRYLLSRASILMSISDAMSEAYYNRYGLKFIPFHNPVTIEEWLPHSKNDWSINDTFRILYTGRLGTANNISILFVSNIINTINLSGIKIKLDIYSSDISPVKAGYYLELKGVEIKPAVPYSTMPLLLSSYDLLLLPLDFDEDGINFARYSMPTKTSEYMISGTPILVFASEQTALAKYAINNGWAYVVTNNVESSLLDALTELRADKMLRMNLALKAKQIAFQNEDAKQVRENFRKCFCHIIDSSH